MRYLFNILLLISSLGCFSQDGLEGIIVEQFYVSGPEDQKGEKYSGELPEGSVTYRIYVDLKPGYTFQAAYGAPGHPLIIRSTEKIFNHIESGATHPNILPERALNKNIALLDSWLSVGAAGENHLGIPKQFDKDANDEYVRFEPGYFQNKSGKEDIALNAKDGMERSTYVPFPTFYQMDSCLLAFGSSTRSNEIILENGAWACMGKGATGADSLTTNTVLIAQITTAGELSFELNLLIGAPNGTSQKYVARDAQPREWIHKDLIHTTAEKKRKRKK